MGVGMCVMVMRVAVVRPVGMAKGSAVPVGAPFRTKRLDDDVSGGTQLGKHRFEHMVARDKEAVRFDLTGRVPVADVPCQTVQNTASHGNQLFGSGDDGNARAVVRLESLAFIDRTRFG